MFSTETDLWEDTLLAIEEGHVVPMVGRDLLVVETESGPQLFHHLVAQKLAAALGISVDGLPPDFDTNDVICGLESFRGDSTEFRSRVVRIVRELKVPVPEPLRLLAEIPKFSLFVSATFDTLLEEAITKVRDRKPAVVAFPTATENTDFSDALVQSNGSVVFQILGRASASADFAITEGQVLEQMHEFMSGPRRPDKLIARLQESHLLILGVGFPDWLARFLIRFTRPKPLWDSRKMIEIIADSAHPQKDLVLFLNRFSRDRSRIFTQGSPVEFVRELHRRWFERNPSQASESVAISNAEKPANMVPGSIFISYASEDRDSAFHLASELGAAGLEVWIDRRLRPGDDFNYIIEGHIRESSAFIPVLSRHTQTQDARWFRKEWKISQDEADKYFGTDRGYIFPVVIDETQNSELGEFRRGFFRRTAVRAPGGNVPPELVQELDRAQKAWRKQNTQR